VRVRRPGRLELGPERHHKQCRQPLQSVDREVEQLRRRRVDPVRVLQDDQHRPPACQPLELGQQGIERARLPLLRVELRARVAPSRRDVEQSGQEFRRVSRVGYDLPQHCFELVQLGLGRLVGPKPGGPLELVGDRPQRAVRVIGRAVVPQGRAGLLPEQLAQSEHNPGLADAGRAGQEHDLALAFLGLPPAVEQQRQLMLAADERREGLSVQGLEPPLCAARA
jgi:hypothetical protein